MEVIEFRPDLAHHFDRINRAWIEELFEIESVDRDILGDPKKHLIETGGAVLFALEGDEILGTVALKKHSEELVELTKMGVYPTARGRGAGKLLMEAVIKKARELGFSKMVLYTNHKLESALRLYERTGFKRLSCYDNLYARCDIQMEMSL